MSDSIYDQMKQAGVGYAAVEYSGQGDEGEVNDVKLYESKAAYGEGRELDGSRSDLTDALSEWTYGALERQGIDWYNNEGGYGTAYLDADARKASVDHYQRYEAANHLPFEVSDGDR